MRVAGLLVGQTLELLRAAVRPGVTTRELDAIAEDNIRSHGGVPSFLGYGHPPFPATICASVNDEVVHGIPGDRVLAEGDVISIDCGAIVDGWHGDAAITVAVGEDACPTTYAELLEVTEESLWRGMAAARLGGRVSDISHAVETYVRGEGGYGILEDYVGPRHRHRHAPAAQRAQRRPPRPRPATRRGAGARRRADGHPRRAARPTSLEDEWTVVTADGSRAAHFEHTFTLTPNGPWVLTAIDGGQARLTELGVPFGGR